VACKFRHLKPAKRKGARFLDVGCGNGAFLPMAEKLGYSSIGIDPDPVAVAQGLSDGRDLRVGTLEANDLPSESFDHITLAHVFEHLHDPVAALAEVHRLLVPGGRLWIVQPNLASLGFAEFGPDWRGLEVPRHMVLMTPKRLIGMLTTHGFTRAKLKKPPYEAQYYYRQSLAIRRGEDPERGADTGWSKDWRARAREADTLSFADPELCESMTVVAFKPESSPSRQPQEYRVDCTSPCHNPGTARL
jgi:SAM-dependent methyltransferase